MANTSKRLSDQDANSTLRGAFNDVDFSLTTNGFLVGKVGRKVEQTISTTNVANDTEVISFYESGTLLYTLTIIYTNGTRDVLLSAERTA